MLERVYRSCLVLISKVRQLAETTEWRKAMRWLRRAFHYRQIHVLTCPEVSLFTANRNDSQIAKVRTLCVVKITYVVSMKESISVCWARMRSWRDNKPLDVCNVTIPWLSPLPYRSLWGCIVQAIIQAMILSYSWDIAGLDTAEHMLRSVSRLHLARQ